MNVYYTASHFHDLCLYEITVISNEGTLPCPYVPDTNTHLYKIQYNTTGFMCPLCELSEPCTRLSCDTKHFLIGSLLFPVRSRWHKLSSQSERPVWGVSAAPDNHHTGFSALNQSHIYQISESFPGSHVDTNLFFLFFFDLRGSVSSQQTSCGRHTHSTFCKWVQSQWERTTGREAVPFLIVNNFIIKKLLSTNTRIVFSGDNSSAQLELKFALQGQ